MGDGPGAAEIRDVLRSLPAKEVVSQVNPWEEFYATDGFTKERPVPPPEEPKKGLGHREYQAQKEAVTEAAFSVRIDREKLAQIEVLKRKRSTFFEKDDSADIAAEQELQACLDNLARLPERLKFEPGITLIVGENGGGKSTLARALHMAAKHHEMTLVDGEPDFANRFIYERRKVQPRDGAYERPDSHDVDLAQAGMSPEIGQTMEVEELQNGVNSSNFHYYDTPILIGHKRPNDYIDPDGDYRSHRQTVDEQLFDYLRRFTERGEDKPGLYFIDEPETGMSPKRHRKLAEEILDVTTNKSIAIVPTNSIVLCDSDLPRIDLEFPERGIHRPSQYIAHTPLPTGISQT